MKNKIGIEMTEGNAACSTDVTARNESVFKIISKLIERQNTNINAWVVPMACSCETKAFFW